MAKSKFFKKSPTSRGHRNFSTGQNQKIPTLNKSWIFILKNDPLTTGGPLGVKRQGFFLKLLIEKKIKDTKVQKFQKLIFESGVKNFCGQVIYQSIAPAEPDLLA